MWRNYVEQHADLFEDGDVEGSIDRKVCSERGIALQEAVNVEVGQTLSWAVDIMIIEGASGTAVGVELTLACSKHG